MGRLRGACVGGVALPEELAVVAIEAEYGACFAIRRGGGEEEFVAEDDG